MNACRLRSRRSRDSGRREWLDFDRAFLVEEGDVELYGVAPTGRRFVASFAKGRALFGGAPALALRIFASEGARLAALPEAALADGSAKSETRAAVIQALDAFVETTSRGLARLAGPRPEANAATAGERRAIAAGQRLSSALGVVWLPSPTKDASCGSSERVSPARVRSLSRPGPGRRRPIRRLGGRFDRRAPRTGLASRCGELQRRGRRGRARARLARRRVKRRGVCAPSATYEARLADSERQWLSALSHAEAEHAAMRDDLDSRSPWRSASHRSPVRDAGAARRANGGRLARRAPRAEPTRSLSATNRFAPTAARFSPFSLRRASRSPWFRIGGAAMCYVSAADGRDASAPRSPNGSSGAPTRSRRLCRTVR